MTIFGLGKRGKFERRMEIIQLSELDIQARPSFLCDRSVVHQVQRMASHLDTCGSTQVRTNLTQLICEEAPTTANLELQTFSGCAINEDPERYTDLDDIGRNVLWDREECLRRGVAHDLRTNLDCMDQRFPAGWRNAVYRAWDGRLFLRNSDRGHHFAAARWHSILDKTPCTLDFHVTTLTLNDTALEALSAYSLFLMDRSSARSVFTAILSTDADSDVELVEPQFYCDRNSVLAFRDGWFSEPLHELAGSHSASVFRLSVHLEDLERAQRANLASRPW